MEKVKIIKIDIVQGCYLQQLACKLSVKRQLPTSKQQPQMLSA